mmetsp:Transcript_57386/g.134569  ORF Transcript_57386/g.134569 Transcript_57386/m.134569 type:complete len:245 (-) Transcript_57386:925-1659(-)
MAPPYRLTTLSRSSSKSSDGDTDATALASSAIETRPCLSCGSRTMLKMAACSRTSGTLTRDKASPNSFRVNRRVLPIPASSMALTAEAIEEYPHASHRRRKSPTVRTGAAASMAMWNCAMDKWPFLSTSNASKTASRSSLVESTPCLCKTRLSSFLLNSFSMGNSCAKVSKASLVVENFSKNRLRNSIITLERLLLVAPPWSFSLPLSLAAALAPPAAIVCPTLGATPEAEEEAVLGAPIGTRK